MNIILKEYSSSQLNKYIYRVARIFYIIFRIKSCEYFTINLLILIPSLTIINKSKKEKKKKSKDKHEILIHFHFIYFIYFH